MPIHGWSHVPAGLFHHFHQSWAATISSALNAGLLPSGFYALLERHTSGVIPDVITLPRRPPSSERRQSPRRIAVAESPANARFLSEASEEEIYAARADRIAIYNPLGNVVSVIEIVSPGNTNSRHAIRSFVEKTHDFLRQGIHILVVDLFPPGTRDPQGIHKLIWEEIRDEPFQLPPDKPLTIGSYFAGVPKKAYVEPVAVGDPFPDMPIFLDCDTYVVAPLEATYRATWEACPEPLRELISVGPQ
jgi:hypothetical protein